VCGDSVVVPKGGAAFARVLRRICLFLSLRLIPVAWQPATANRGNSSCLVGAMSTHKSCLRHGLNVLDPPSYRIPPIEPNIPLTHPKTSGKNSGSDGDGLLKWQLGSLTY